MADIKIIGGSPQPGNPATRVVVSTNLNADDKLPTFKPEGERIVGGSPQPGHPDYRLPKAKHGRRIVAGKATA